ncbi:MAG: HAMP domain-containing histidine kinase [Clostridia bacterium]|nr:HAMP domain-containing histidine kinase [Clostridia bacterium]
MIRKLQRKFILVSMVVLLTVLLVIIGTVNVVNYASVVRDADELLEVLSANRGRFPDRGFGENHKIPPHWSPEIPFESRFFSVVYDAQTGEVLQTDTGHIISVTAAEATAMADQVLAEKADSGFLDTFRFLRCIENGRIRIIFLDCGRKLDSFHSFLLASTLISLLGVTAVGILLLLLSRRIVRPLSESYAKQKQFITNAGHEIKTPLTIIRADLDVLEMEFGENEWLQDIQKQTQRLTTLTNDLVMLSRMEEDRPVGTMIEFPLSDVVSEAADSFHTLAQAQHKKLSMQVQPMLSFTGNEKAIHQLVTLLLDNALKYSPADSTISLELSQQGRWFRLRVRNVSVYPLPDGNLNVLFERFYRADPARSTIGGHGIGLSVAKAITEQHKGKIQASSPDATSLIITVLLPVN